MLRDPSFISAASRKHRDKPIVTYATGDWRMVEQMRQTLEKQSVPVYYSPEDAAQALTVMHRYSRIRAGSR